MQKKDNILDIHTCLSQEQMFAYIDGSLSMKDQHRVEKHIHSCEMCADELDGLSQLSKSEATSAIDQLQEQLHQTHLGKQKTIAFWMRKEFVAAASIVLLLGFGYSLKVLFDMEQAIEVAQEQALEKPLVVQSETKSIAQVKDDDSVIETHLQSEPVPETVQAEQKNVAISKPLPAPQKVTKEVSAEVNNVPQMIIAEERPVLRADEGFSRASDFNPQPELAKSSMALIEEEVEDQYEEPIALSELAEDDIVLEFSMSSDQTNAIATEAAPKTVSKKKEASAKQRKYKTGNSKTFGHVSTPKDQFFNVEESAHSPYNSPSHVIAKRYYNHEEYSKAIKQYKKALSGNENNLDYQYHIGLCYYEVGEYENALSYTDAVIEYGTSKFYADAQWSKVQILEKLGDTTSMQLLLNVIFNEEGKYKLQAKEKLETHSSSK